MEIEYDVLWRILVSGSFWLVLFPLGQCDVPDGDTRALVEDPTEHHGLVDRLMGDDWIVGILVSHKPVLKIHALTGCRLNGLFGVVATARPELEWAEFASECCTTWGSFGYLCSALCQWYEAVNKHPVEEVSLALI